MKKINIFAVLFLLVLFSNVYANDWVIKVNNTTVTKKQFDESLYVRISSSISDELQIVEMTNDINVRMSYLDTMINEIVLLDDADKNKYFSDKDEKIFLKSVERSAKASFFYTQSVEALIEQQEGIDITITDEDIQKALKTDINLSAYSNLEEISEDDKNRIIQYLKAIRPISEFENKIKELKKSNKIKADINILGDSDKYKGSTLLLKLNKQSMTLDEFNKELAYAIFLQNPVSYNSSYINNYEFRIGYFDSVLSQFVLVEEGNRERAFGSDNAKSYISSYVAFMKYQRYSNYLISDFVYNIKNVDDEVLENYFDRNSQAFAAIRVYQFNEASKNVVLSYYKYETAQKELILYLSDLKDNSAIEVNTEALGIL